MSRVSVSVRPLSLTLLTPKSQRRTTQPRTHCHASVHLEARSIQRWRSSLPHLDSTQRCQLSQNAPPNRAYYPSYASASRSLLLPLPSSALLADAATLLRPPPQPPSSIRAVRASAGSPGRLGPFRRRRCCLLESLRGAERSV